MTTRLLLIRHAATDPRGRLCGTFDVPLSAEGRAQVNGLIKRIEGRPGPDELLTSTLQRAREVAEALGRAWDLRPRTVEWAREIHCGEVEGMPLVEVQRRFPDLWIRNEAQKDETFAWPGGESYAAFRARILRGLEAAVSAWSGKRVAIVTHAGVISQVIGVIRGRPASVWAPDRPHPLTATEIAWHNGAPASILSYDVADWW